MPAISIITATYNSATCLKRCIQSVDAQTDRPEHIFVDGLSTDDTVQIIQQNSQSMSRVISERDEGFYEAINKGILASSGDIVGVLNSDDFYINSNVLEKVASIFNTSSVDACYGDLNYINSEEKITRKWRSGRFSADKFYWGWMPPHPTFFVRRSVYEKYGLFNLAMGTAADYELMLRFCVRHQINVVYIPEVLVHMRTGGMSNRSIKNRIQANTMDRKAWAVNDLKPYPWTLTMKPLRKIGQWLA